MKRKTDELEQKFMNRLVAQVALRLRSELLRRLREEKARHWKMRGSHRLGLHFERGFFRGVKHAHDLIAITLDPAKIRARIRKGAKR